MRHSPVHQIIIQRWDYPQDVPYRVPYESISTLYFFLVYFVFFLQYKSKQKYFLTTFFLMVLDTHAEGQTVWYCIFFFINILLTIYISLLRYW